MSDLISRSALIEAMYQKMSLMCASRDGQHLISMETVIDFVKDYPVAYDVDKVVEELEEASFPHSLGTVTENVMLRDKAIEIVKGGGVNERD